MKSPDAMATPVKFEKYALLAIVALHLIVQVTHGYSHSVAGGSFSLPVAGSPATIVNASSEIPAKVITFRLR